MTSIPRHQPQTPADHRSEQGEGPKITPPPPQVRSKKATLALILGSLTVLFVALVLLARM